MADPVEQRVGVGRVEDLADGVARALGAQAGGDREQVQVVIAEHDGRARAEVDECAQRGEESGPRLTTSPAIHSGVSAGAESFSSKDWKAE